MPDFSERMADSVVANQGAGDKSFIVDGEPFPWFITEEGPTAVHLKDDLFSVQVDIFVLDVDNVNEESFTAPAWYRNPVIAGREFPWLITEDGIQYTVSRCEPALVRLAFFARKVVGVPVLEDKRTNIIRDMFGDVIYKEAAA